MIMLAAALLLAAATIAVWFVAAGARAAARLQVRFAAVLLAAVAVAAALLPVAAPAVVLLVLPIATTVLAMAAAAGFRRPLPPIPAAAVLALVSLCGIASAATGLAMFALGAALLAGVALLLIGVRRLDLARLASAQTALAALCLLAGQSAFALERVGAPFLLFVAAGLLGTALGLSRSDAPVEETPGGDLRTLPVGGQRTFPRLGLRIHQDLS
jgi:hypothetical protein